MNLLRRIVGAARRRPPPPPLSATINLADPAVSIDPFPWYERLRGEGDVVHLAHHDCWIVLGYEAAREVFARPDLFSSAPYAFVDPVMLAADPPRHAPVRRIVSRAFAGDTLRRLETLAGTAAEELLRSELDVVADFARPLSRRVAADLIGFDDAALAAIAAAEDASAGEADSFARLCTAIDAVAPGARMFAGFAADGAELLGPDDARSLVRLLWLASAATTERTMAHCVLHFLKDPALHRRLRADPRLIPAFVEETVRLNPPENLILRITAAPAELRGVAIPQGASLQICLPAANRDPAAFDVPAALRLDRLGASNLSFGSGIHHCVGGPLTRRVIRAALTVFLARSETLRPLQPLSEISWLHAMVVLAPRALKVAL